MVRICLEQDGGQGLYLRRDQPDRPAGGHLVWAPTTPGPQDRFVEDAKRWASGAWQPPELLDDPEQLPRLDVIGTWTADGGLLVAIDASGRPVAKGDTARAYLRLG